MELLPKKRPGSEQYLAPKGSTSWLLLVGTEAGLNSEPPNLRPWINLLSAVIHGRCS